MGKKTIITKLCILNSGIQDWKWLALLAKTIKCLKISVLCGLCDTWSKNININYILFFISPWPGHTLIWFWTRAPSCTFKNILLFRNKSLGMPWDNIWWFEAVKLKKFNVNNHKNSLCTIETWCNTICYLI